ncbi:predicted protein [Chaetoceros tenuissimus]|uniref:MYND-type domain-containing protein n=1 Tax=Chaetoceros tenuissimus TaxID=426638 RepID=A0AAD3H7W5_9STRA|nr:predicted protein [Chaetoceros tenuissimus]
MGKKTKRLEANRKNQTIQSRTRGISTANDKFQRIEQAVDALYEDACNMYNDFLYTQAQAKISKIASLLEAEKDMLMKNHSDYYKQRNIHAHEKLAHVEILRRNFQAVIPIHDFCESIAIMTDKLYLMYCLALMVTGKENSFQASNAALEYLHSIHTSNSNGNHLGVLGIYWHMFLIELRRKRKWDEALDFTIKLGSNIEVSTLYSSPFMLATTYIERYRVDARKRPRSKQNHMSVSLYKYISTLISEGYDQTRKGLFCAHENHDLLLAQWLYLNHHGSSKIFNNFREYAIQLVEDYIRNKKTGIYRMELCLGCRQKTASSDPGLVCSGCRVACYCSHEHQRSSWKKELDWGVGIGHKMLCPLYKALRKCREAHERCISDTRKYNLRLEKECEKFLSNGLGLKDLCFPQEFVDEYGEVFGNAKWKSLLTGAPKVWF